MKARGSGMLKRLKRGGSGSDGWLQKRAGNTGFSFAVWLPDLEVVEDDGKDVGGEGCSIDGVDLVDLLHDGQLRETVLLQKNI